MRSSTVPSSGVRVRGRGQLSAMLSLAGTLPAKLVDLEEKKMCTLPEAGFFLREHSYRSFLPSAASCLCFRMAGLVLWAHLCQAHAGCGEFARQGGRGQVRRRSGLRRAGRFTRKKVSVQIDAIVLERVSLKSAEIPTALAERKRTRVRARHALARTFRISECPSRVKTKLHWLHLTTLSSRAEPLGCRPVRAAGAVAAEWLSPMIGPG